MSLERLPKQFQPYYERVPQDLQKEFDALPIDVLIATLQELDKFHRPVEKMASDTEARVHDILSNLQGLDKTQELFAEL